MERTQIRTNKNKTMDRFTLVSPVPFPRSSSAGPHLHTGHIQAYILPSNPSQLAPLRSCKTHCERIKEIKRGVSSGESRFRRAKPELSPVPTVVWAPKGRFQVTGRHLQGALDFGNYLHPTLGQYKDRPEWAARRRLISVIGLGSPLAPMNGKLGRKDPHHPSPSAALAGIHS